MLTRLLQTENAKGVAVARILLGALVFIRGAQGLLGWFGGSGIQDLSGFLGLVSLSAPLVLLAVFINFFGGIGIIAGLFTRVAAILVAADAAFAVVLWSVSRRAFEDWSITQGGASLGYYLLAFALALVLSLEGAGGFSLDHMLFYRKLSHEYGRFHSYNSHEQAVVRGLGVPLAGASEHAARRNASGRAYRHIGES
jgi:putative oxidoreductase